MITLALLNAHADLLAAIVEVFSMTDSEKNEALNGGEAPVLDIVKTILDTTYDHMPAFILALGLYPFSDQFKQRVQATMEFLIELVSRRKDEQSQGSAGNNN